MKRELTKKREKNIMKCWEYNTESNSCRGELGGHVAYYNKLKDQLDELDKLLTSENKQ